MIIIGLTGSIGTGKTTVTRQFAQCGAHTLDSDAVVHRLLGKKGAAVEAVARLFPEALEKDQINRKSLGAEVFGHPAKLRQLEGVVHPLVRQAQDRFIRNARKCGARIVVLDIPLLYETGGEKRCDVTVVTSAPFWVQQRRVLARSSMTLEKFARILAAQMSTAEKILRADFVVPTGLGKASSLQAVKRIILRLSSKNGFNQP